MRRSETSRAWAFSASLTAREPRARRPGCVVLAGVWLGSKESPFGQVKQDQVKQGKARDIAEVPST